MFGALISAVLLIGVVDCQTFNVLNYGAAADGQKDDSPAFAKAWKDVCNSTGKPTLHIPAKRAYLLNPVAFSGPCKSGNINVDLWGTLQAPASPSAWKGLDQSRWIIFKNVNGLKIAGPGLVDGRGQQWWSISCQHNPGKALSFIGCNGVTMSQIRFRDSPQTHVLILGSTNVQFWELSIHAPGKSPNTDGIHISSSKGIAIHNTIIGTGDDCVSIGDQCSNINVTGLVCGPGHGVSIGSLGMDGGVANVQDIRVHRVHFIGTTNGARIKTWQARE
ncbi:hypothetical protein CDL15_Pgr015093 [Punica granatum]|uniref:Polygalacturonase At3g15720 n=1 Tax=Punica granatum TaxID=22663 RepID=A0A218WZX9_PUNGR|nr:hypothetical protein CDL15_Pgr015093 [Punica granatum]